MQEKDLKSSKPKECVISIIQDASENYAHIQRNVRALQDIHSQYGDEVNGWIEVCLAKVLSSRCGIRNAEGALRFFEVYLKKGFNGPTGKLKSIITC